MGSFEENYTALRMFTDQEQATLRTVRMGGRSTVDAGPEELAKPSAGTGAGNPVVVQSD